VILHSSYMPQVLLLHTFWFMLMIFS